MSALIDRLARAYRYALVLYPSRFRNEYGDEMTGVFHGRVVRARARRGSLGALACTFRALLDLAINAPLQRLTALQRRSRVPTRRQPRSKGDQMPTRTLRNLRYAVRTLIKQPALAITIVVVLAIGTAATISIFSIVDAALVRPLPYPDGERLTSIVQTSETFGTYPFAAPFLSDLRQRTRSFDSLAGLSPSWSMTMTGVGEPRAVVAAYVSDGLFEMLGARPSAGRLFEPVEHLADGPQVAVVSRQLWDQHFGADTPLDGQIIRLSGQPHTVIGVVDGLRMPITTSSVALNGRSADLWLPFVDNPFAEMRNIPVMHVVGRLADGVSVAQAGAELEGIRPELDREFPDVGLGAAFVTLPLAELVAQD